MNDVKELVIKNWELGMDILPVRVKDQLECRKVGVGVKVYPYSIPVKSL